MHSCIPFVDTRGYLCSGQEAAELEVKSKQPWPESDARPPAHRPQISGSRIPQRNGSEKVSRMG